MLGRVIKNLAQELSWAEATVSQASFFTDIKQRYGLNNVAYLGVNLPTKNYYDYFVHATYEEEWVKHYQTKDYVAIDPIVRRGFMGLMPIDWSETGRLTLDQMRLFNEAREFKVGNRGLTFPLHGVHNETAIFSVTAEMNDKQWVDFKREHLRDMRIAGDVFHQHVVGKVLGTKKSEPELTSREKECLRWSAEGKTRDDIADILGLSPRVVKFHLEGARAKLGALNITHSVASAVLRGLI